LGFKKETSSSNLPKSRNYVGELRIQALVLLHHHYLQKVGWHESKTHNLSIQNNIHVPWITYPALTFLYTLNLESKTILEFGSGSSTVYFSKRAFALTSFEESCEYIEAVKQLVEGTPSQIIALVPNTNTDRKINLSDLQTKALQKDIETLRREGNIYEYDEYFGKIVLHNILNNWGDPDLIFIDGGFRNLELLLASESDNEDLIVILDNSDREEYSIGISALRNAGFVEIQFEGLGPLNYYSWRTSFFLKKIESIVNLRK
jgi:hypothetical protein